LAWDYQLLLENPGDVTVLSGTSRATNVD